jgi:hypothetical protein
MKLYDITLRIIKFSGSVVKNIQGDVTMISGPDQKITAQAIAYQVTNHIYSCLSNVCLQLQINRHLLLLSEILVCSACPFLLW